MANVKFNKGLYANLPAQSTEGALYFCTDESIYIGLANGAYHRFGDFIEVANVASLPEKGAHAKALYYCTAENVLAKWTGTEWKQINLNTTYTIAKGSADGSIKLVGSNGTSEELQVVDVAGLESAIAEAKAAADDAQADVDALAEKVGTVEDGKTVVGMISDNATEIADLAAIVAAMTGDEEGSVGSISEAIKAQIDALDVEDTAVEGQFVVAVSEADGKITVTRQALKASDIPEIGMEKVTGLSDAIADAKKAGTDANDALETYKETNDVAVGNAQTAAENAMTEAQKKVASVGAGDASVTVGGTATAPTVAVKVSEDTDNAITLEDDGLKVVIPTAAEYTIVKDANSGDYAAVYHMEKDGVQVGTSINIPKDMVVESGAVVENPEGQEAGTYIKLVLQNVEEPLYINVGSLIEYVTSGSATGDMVVVSVSEDHKVTATITDGTITLAKLDADTQAKINKAHTHTFNETELNKIGEGDVEKWNSAEQNAKDYADDIVATEKARAEAAEAKALSDAKEYADGLNTAMDTRVKAIEDDYLKSADKTELADDIAEVDTKFASYSTTEQMNSAIEAVNTALDSRLDALEAIDHDAYKEYSEGVANTAETNAKAYTDNMLQWAEF